MLRPRNGFAPVSISNNITPGGKQTDAPTDWRPSQLLWRHICRRTQHIAYDRQLRQIDMGDAEIGELNLVVCRYHDISRLDVAMDNPIVVNERERAQHLLHNEYTALDRKSACFFQ